MLTAGQLLDFCTRQLGEVPTDTDIVTMSFDWINKVKNHITSYGRWRFLEEQGTLTIPTNGIVYFPDYVWEVLSLYPSNLGYRRPTQVVNARQFDDAGPSITAGLSSFQIPWGFYGVHADTTAAGTITATSSAGAADNTMVVVVEGVDNSTNRYEVVERITLAGAGTATTTNSFASGVGGVQKVYIEPATNTTSLTQGIITITDSAGVTIERLDSSRENWHEHIRAELYPASAQTGFTYRYYRRVRDAVSRENLLEIPREFNPAFQSGLLSEVSLYHGDKPGYLMHKQEMNELLDELRRREERRPGMRRSLSISPRYRRRFPWINR